MYFIDYSTLEEKIFNNVRKYFEKLTPIASDDYNNAFSDVIAQYGCGGEDYLIAEYLFSDLIEVQTELAFEKMPVEEQKEIREFYEKHFLDNSFYDEEQEEFNYSNEDLALSLSDSLRYGFMTIIQSMIFQTLKKKMMMMKMKKMMNLRRKLKIEF